MKSVAKDFPVLNQKVTFLDSAATSLKPQKVIDAITDYYQNYSANIHRGLYKMSERASAEYESTRETVAQFINAPSSKEIVFTRNATESVNVIASTIGKTILDKDDEIVTTIIEHHANFVPWQSLASQTGASLRIIDINDQSDLDIYDDNDHINLQGVVTKNTWIFAINYVSNVLGTIQPLKEIITAARKIQPKLIVVVDAAQASPHIPIDVQDLDCDFLVFSSHKMCGPTGIGVLWGREVLLENMPPYQLGGDMIQEVHIHESTFADVPHRFEAGTPHIAGVIGLKAAIEYLQDIGMTNVWKHEEKLGKYLTSRLIEEFGSSINILGAQSLLPRVGLAAFTFDDCHSHDVAGILDEEGIAVRAGHHCAMPLHEALDVHSTTRASLYLYNTEKDIEHLIKALHKVRKLLCQSTKK